MIKRRCPNCNKPGFIITGEYCGSSLKNKRERYQNECMNCGWKTKRTRYVWQADRAWNRRESDGE